MLRLKAPPFGVVLLVWIGLFLASPTLWAQSVAIVPSELERVPLGDVGDGLYWQQLQVTLAHDDLPSSEAIRIHLPSLLVLYDADGDGALFDEVRVVYRSVDAELPRFETSTTTTESLIVLSSQSPAAAGGQVYVQFPCRSTATPTGTSARYGAIEFADERETDLTQQVPEILFVGDADLAASGSMGIVDMAAQVATGTDTLTSARGTVFPDQPAVLMLGLPDLVFDGGQAHPNRRTGLGDGDDANDTPYRFFFATSPNLTSIGSDLATEAVLASDGTPYTETEGLGAQVQLLTRDLPAATYWLYVVSDVTGRIPLGRSRAIQIRHQPVIERLGPLAGDSLAADAIVYDSGGLLDFSGVANGEGLRRLVIDLELIDHDDSARVHLFYSADPNLGPVDIVLTDPSNLDLTGATRITASEGLAESTRRVDWSTTRVAEGDYYVYAVAAGGTEANVERSAYQVLVRHTPFLRLDDLEDLTAGEPIVTGGGRPQRYLTLNWGLGGIEGDADADDEAQISLFLSPNPDHPVPGGATQIRQDAEAVLIAEGLAEEPDSRASNQFVWDLWGLAGTAAVPRVGDDYYVYGLIDDGSVARLTRMGGSEHPTALRFEHPPTLRPLQPATALTIGAGESARVSWQDMDLDDDAALRIIISAENHGDTTSYANVVSGQAYVINSADGFALSEVGEEDLSEDDDVDAYDLRTDHLQRGPNTSTAPQPGTYHVYLSMTDAGAFGPDTRAWRAPGTLTLSGPGTVPERRVFALQPENFTIGIGGAPQRIDVVVDALEQPVDLVRVSLQLDGAVFDVVDQDLTREGVQPFYVRPGFSASKLATNTATVSPEGSLLLRCEYFDPAPAGLPALAGDRAVVAFDIAAIAGEGSSDLQLLSDADNDQPSQLERDGDVVVTPGAQPLATARLIPGRGTVNGIIGLEGRIDRTANVDVGLRRWGAFVDLDDSLFAASNDIDPDRDGVQVPLAADGSFQLSQTPTGRLDLHVRVDGYLQGRVAGLEIYPGGVLTGVRPSTAPGDTLLLGGDVAGYLDEDGVSRPDNEITLADWDFVASLFDRSLEEVPDSVRADITGDGSVNIRDLTLVGANYLSRGPAPVYRQAGSGGLASSGPTRLYLAYPPQAVRAGDTLEVSLQADSWQGIRAAEVALSFDSADWDLLQTRTSSQRLLAERRHPWGGRWAVTRRGMGDLRSATPVIRWRWVARTEGAQPPRIIDALLLDSRYSAIAVDTDAPTTAVAEASGLPIEFGLRSNYPNPFNPQTTIRFDVGAADDANVRVVLDIYDVLGQRIVRLLQEAMPAGHHKVTWDGRDRFSRPVASGVYYARLRAGLFTQTRPMLLLK